MQRLCFTFALTLLLTTAAGAVDVIRVGMGPFLAAGPFYIARDKGYFKKVGIDVEARIFEDGSLAVPAMIAGELEFTNMPAAAGLFNSVAKGAPLSVILDQGRNRPGRAYTVVAVPNKVYDEGVHSLADLAKLKGRKFGANSLGSINQYNLGRALQKVGLNPAKDVEWFTNVSQPDLMKMLGQNQMDVVDFAFQFGRFSEANKLGHQIATGDQIEPDAQIATIVVRKDYVASHRDAVIRWAMAYLQGIKDFNAAAMDPGSHSDIVDILANSTVLKNPQLVKAIAPNWGYVSDDGLPNVGFIMQMQDFWINAGFGFIQKPVSQQELFDLSIAKDAKERLQQEKPFG